VIVLHWMSGDGAEAVLTAGPAAIGASLDAAPLIAAPRPNETSALTNNPMAARRTWPPPKLRAE
jgi:hypothetical protein